MKTRKIQSAYLKPYKQGRREAIVLNGHSIHMDYTICEYLRGENSEFQPVHFKFALRKFPKAKRLVFEANTDEYNFYIFECFPNRTPGVLWLCRKQCLTILGIGEKTKKFSIWVRKES